MKKCDIKKKSAFGVLHKWNGEASQIFICWRSDVDTVCVTFKMSGNFVNLRAADNAFLNS